ncbi:MAG: hypothetical protein ACRC20_03145 [Segniliparus sp.]|uniref:hypothetical protein n=1 Tax=Segniliparus sp. TaxID=2804064 RepID=UPI003F3ADEF2
MDFSLRYDRWYLPLATALGAGPKRTLIRVAEGTLQVKHGWIFRIDVPLASVESARRTNRRPLAWGVHTFSGGWLVNGSRDGVVEIGFASPVKPAKAPLFNWPVRSLALSLEDPEGFLAALRR